MYVCMHNLFGMFDYMIFLGMSVKYFLPQVCDLNGRWYLADGGLAPGDMLLITGKALSHATAGLRPAASYRAAPEYLSGINNGGRYMQSCLVLALLLMWQESSSILALLD